MHILYICFLLNLGYVQIFAKQEDWHAARCPFVIAVIKHLAKRLKSGGCDGAAVWGKNQIPRPCCRQHFQGSVWGSNGLHRTSASELPCSRNCNLDTAIQNLGNVQGSRRGEAGSDYSNFNAIAALTSKLQMFHQACESSTLDPYPSSEGHLWFFCSSTILPSLTTHWKFKGCKPPPV